MLFLIKEPPVIQVLIMCQDFKYKANAGGQKVKVNIKLENHHRSGWGVPHPMSGVPHPGLDGGGYPRYPPQPQPGLDGGGYPSYPLDLGWGTPLHPPIRQSSMVNTSYEAGSMPLAFTQEDFLVV